MISEKEMMIVDAVNKLKADCAPIRDCKTIYRIGGGEFNFGMNVTEDTICTIKEYNQCIREMSEGAFVPDAKPEFVYGQDVYLKVAIDSERSFKFGCFSLDGESAIVLYEGGYAYAKLSNLSSKPVKTKEEIELEEAKKKQVDYYSYVYSHYFKNKAQAREMFLDMQNSSELAEILSPLESK